MVRARDGSETNVAQSHRWRAVSTSGKQWRSSRQPSSPDDICDAVVKKERQSPDTGVAGIIKWYAYRETARGDSRPDNATRCAMV